MSRTSERVTWAQCFYLAPPGSNAHPVPSPPHGFAGWPHFSTAFHRDILPPVTAENERNKAATAAPRPLAIGDEKGVFHSAFNLCSVEHVRPDKNRVAQPVAAFATKVSFTGESILLCHYRSSLKQLSNMLNSLSSCQTLPFAFLQLSQPTCTHLINLMPPSPDFQTQKHCPNHFLKETIISFHCTQRMASYQGTFSRQRQRRAGGSVFLARFSSSSGIESSLLQQRGTWSVPHPFPPPRTRIDKAVFIRGF